MKPFPELLREAREAKGLSAARLAQNAGMHPSSVTRLERGERRASRPAVMALAEALGVTPRQRDDMLAGAGFHVQSPVTVKQNTRLPEVIEFEAAMAHSSLSDQDRDDARTALRQVTRALWWKIDQQCTQRSSRAFRSQRAGHDLAPARAVLIRRQRP